MQDLCRFFPNKIDHSGKNSRLNAWLKLFPNSNSNSYQHWKWKGKLIHRITEWSGLEGTSRIMNLQPPCHRQGHQPPHLILEQAAPSNLALNTSRDRASTTNHLSVLLWLRWSELSQCVEQGEMHLEMM